MTSERTSGSILVLMVEDNPDDVELTREVLVETKLRIDLRPVGDGV